MKGKITLIGCPKLDDVDYSEKLTEIIRDNDIKSVTIVRMEHIRPLNRWKSKARIVLRSIKH